MTEWISVDVRLPEHLQEVKVKGDFPEEIHCQFKKGLIDNGFVLISNNQFYQIQITGITHWMPLPER